MTARNQRLHVNVNVDPKMIERALSRAKTRLGEATLPDRKGLGIKCFLLPMSLVVDLLQVLHTSQPWDLFGLPCFEGDLPDGVVLLGVRDSFELDAFIVKLGHPSWPRLKEGESPPLIRSDRVFQFVLDKRYRCAPPGRPGSR